MLELFVHSIRVLAKRRLSSVYLMIASIEGSFSNKVVSIDL